MTDSDVPISGEGEAVVPPPSLDSELASFAGQLYVPKLRANQVIVCLALVLVLIGLDFGVTAIETRAIKPVLQGTVTVAASWWTRIIVQFHTASFAICLVTSGVLIRCRCFQTLGRLQPGHWIVLILATGGILRCIASPFNLLTFTYPSPHGSAQHTFEAMQWFTVLAVGGLFAFAAIRLRDAKRWKVLLFSGSASVFYWAIPLMPFSTRAESDVLKVYLWSLPFWSAIFAALPFVVVFIDWPRRATRDWPHWLGVLLWTLGSLAALVNAMQVVWRFATV